MRKRLFSCPKAGAHVRPTRQEFGDDFIVLGDGTIKKDGHEAEDIPVMQVWINRTQLSYFYITSTGWKDVN